VTYTITATNTGQVAYAAADGQALPLGQECLFPVEACVKAP